MKKQYYSTVISGGMTRTNKLTMQYIQTLPNGVQIDMTYLILKQLQGEITRDELQQVINDNIVKNS